MHRRGDMSKYKVMQRTLCFFFPSHLCPCRAMGYEQCLCSWFFSSINVMEPCTHTRTHPNTHTHTHTRTHTHTHTHTRTHTRNTDNTATQCPTMAGISSLSGSFIIRSACHPLNESHPSAITVGHP